ncbi:3-dehydroquinate synthase [Thermodesulfobacteriota bacterium]
MKPEAYIADHGHDVFPVDYYQQRFSVPFEYPVYFTKNLFDLRNDLLASVVDRHDEHRRHRVQVFIDSGVVVAIPDLVESVQDYIKIRHELLKLEGAVEIVPGGEQAKNSWDLTKQVMAKIADRHLCRQSFVLAIGGGSVLDMVGLSASLVHRGLRLIRVPTTVLAQNDAGVGVKNGVNNRGVKNFAGTFAPPFAVLIDYRFLRTLSHKYWLGGIAEAFKVAIIIDRDFFDYLSRNATKLKERDEAAIEETVKRCAILHLEHIRTNCDPFEFGSARPLDFGHWSAHRLETLSGYDMGHGQAVSIGIALDSFYAYKVGLLSLEERDAIIDALEESGLPIWSDLLELKTSGDRLEILQGLDEFQEHLGGQLTVTLPHHIGRKIEIHEMDASIIKKAVAYLKKRSGQSR